MSNDARGSKKNRPSDANHVSAKDKAQQRRKSKQNEQ
jgi:hypothetical protein